MPSSEPIVICQTPTPGKQPTSIPKWKYDLIRAAIIDILPLDDEGIEFKILPDLVRDPISAPPSAPSPGTPQLLSSIWRLRGISHACRVHPPSAFAV